MATVAIALASFVSVALAQVADSKLPAVQVAPRKVDFQKFHIGMTSPPHGVAFTNKSGVDLPAPSVAVSGAGFSLFANECTAALSPHGSCPVSVTFKPMSKGKFHGLL